MNVKERLSAIRNEEGIAMAMVLVISAILLAIMSAMMYMMISGTQLMGLQKRYNTAYEAAMGGADFAYQFIALRSDPLLAGLTESVTMSSTCQSDKLLKATANWNTACDKSLTIDPATSTSYDMYIDLGTGTKYRVYAKIVDTIPGNTGGTTSSQLMTGGTTFIGGGGGNMTVVPYLYTIELDSENTSNPQERAKLSVLYEY